MRRTAGIWIILIPFFWTGEAAGQAWSFRQCLDTALRRNITVNQSQLTNELNRVTLEQNKASRIPGVSASAGESLNVGKNVDPTTNTFVTEAYHSTNLGISSSFNLFNGLQTANTIRQNRLNVQAGEFETEKVKNDITINITTGYLQVLFYMEILDAARKQEEATAAQVDRTEKLVNAGKSPESDLLQIRSQLASDNLTVINVSNQLDLARITLMQLMEIPVQDNFTIEKPVLVEAPAVLPESSSVVYERSLAVQPQIKGAAFRTNASEMALKVSEGARWPRVSLGANLNTNYASSRKKGSVNPEGYPFFEQIWDNIGQSFSMGVSIPIYSNRQIKSNIDRAKINLASTKLSEQNVRNVLRKTIEQTYADTRAAVRKLDAVKQQYAATEAAYLNAEKKYTVGVMNATDFLIQKNNLTQSLSNLIQAKYDLVFKQKILDFYQGKEINL